MSNVIPFESSNVPAHLVKPDDAAQYNSSLIQATGGFPVLSIKGKTFTIVSNGNRQIITKPEDDDEPATSLEVIIVAANPHRSKVYYAKAYEDGVAESPDCYSNNGVGPEADAANPQCGTCAACPHNTWGSGKEGRGKACSDSHRLAVAPAGQVNEPLLLRVPPASLRPLSDYATMLSKRGVAFDAVVTRIGFEAGESSPKLKFKPVSFLDEDTYAEVQKVAEDKMTKDIIGVSSDGAPSRIEGKQEAPAPKAKAKPAPVEEEAPAPKAEPKAAKPKAEPAPVVEEDDDDLDALLAEFDD